MRLRFDKITASQVFKDPYKRVNEYSQLLDKYIKSLEASVKNSHNKAKIVFTEKVARLDTLSPLKTLSRGYSITQKDGKIVKSKNDLNKDDKIEIRFADGEKHAKIV